ncbi:hypothetical protein EcB171_3169 [Escherichia coli B171]|nr:hypothetical protein EcB171_3169 [Escherichia coli B171]
MIAYSSMNKTELLKKIYMWIILLLMLLSCLKFAQQMQASARIKRVFCRTSFQNR